MGLFRRRKEEKIEGCIGGYKLQQWWVETFSPEEREHIDEVFQDNSVANADNPVTLTKGSVTASDQEIARFLVGLAGCFKGPTERHIGERILLKAEKEALRINDIDSLHFIYLGMINNYYRERENEGYFDKAIAACNKQIDLSVKVAASLKKRYPSSPLPSHTGYEQLAIIYDKQKNHEEAIRLCKMAKEQGWAGEWDERILRYEKKLKK